MAAENFDLHEMWAPRIYNFFLKTFLRNLETYTMGKLVAFFVFPGMAFFKRLSISWLENLENLLCNAIFSKNFQLHFNFKITCMFTIFGDYGILAHRP